ncbi:MAG: acyl-ACP thioesterase domain-containing protein [Acidimicrobiia bacterium]
MDTELAPRPATGRVVTRARPVRVSDTTVDGRLRLDAVARYFQDVSADDTSEVDLERKEHWVVRRLVVEVRSFPVLREQVELSTWCGAIGSHYAERRVSVSGERGGSIEAAALWVHIDVATGRPRRLPDAFASIYGEAAGGRRARARLELGDPPAGAGPARPWPLRVTDLDVLGHVNNAAYWSPVEEVLADRPDLAPPLRAVMEHRGALDRSTRAEVLTEAGSEGVALWIVGDGEVCAAAHLGPLGA